MLVILGGVALLHILVLGGLAVTGGCASDNDALEGKAYIPSPDPEPVAPVQTTQQQPVYDTPAPQIAAPVAPAKTDYPSFESFQSSNPLPSTPASTGKGEFIKHTVAKGESLWKIARTYGVSTEELAAFNNLSANKTIKIGQVINIPPGGHPSAKTAAAPKAEKKTAAKTEKKSSAPAASAAPAKTAKKDVKKETAAPAGTEEYTIKAGDSLGKIAAKYHVKASAIAEANKITDEKKLKIGQKLVIPKAGAKTATAAPAKTEDKKPATPTDKPATTEHKDELLDDIPAPGAPAAKPAAPSETPVAAPATVAPVADAPVAGLTHEIEEDTTIDNIAAQFAISADTIRKLNPNLPADGKLKAGIAIKLP